jgi:tripartite-type tricarboxylate transporter receptor subunit TctC
VDVIAGQIPIYFMNALQAVPHMKQGRVRPLGVTSDKRFRGLPSVPTIAEAGVPGYSMTNWYGMLAPAGTPRASFMKLHAELVRAHTATAGAQGALVERRRRSDREHARAVRYLPQGRNDQDGEDRTGIRDDGYELISR